MGRPYYIFGQFRETARCRDAQHGDGVCCALATQLVNVIIVIITSARRYCDPSFVCRSVVRSFGISLTSSAVAGVVEHRLT